MLSGEGPLVGAAEQKQCVSEVDRSGVDGVEALDELAAVAVRVVAGHVEERLRDRQRGAQLVRRVGGEPPLLGYVRLEPCEQAVDRVGEILQLVARSGEREALVQIALGDLAGRSLSSPAAGAGPDLRSASRARSRRRS